MSIGNMAQSTPALRLEDVIASPEEIAADPGDLPQGGVLEITNFFRQDIADKIRHMMDSATEESSVRAKKPSTTDDVVGYAPHVAVDEWDALSSDEKFLSFSQLKLDLLGEVGEFLCGAEFREWIASISGCDLREAHSDIHVMRRGDFIGYHTDARDRREVGMIVYLTPDWDENYGGVLESRRDSGTRRFVPIYNRAIIFGVDGLAEHRVTAVESDVPRLTFGLWFLGK